MLTDHELGHDCIFHEIGATCSDARETEVGTRKTTRGPNLIIRGFIARLISASNTINIYTQLQNRSSFEFAHGWQKTNCVVLFSFYGTNRLSPAVKLDTETAAFIRPATTTFPAPLCYQDASRRLQSPNQFVSIGNIHLQRTTATVHF